MKSILTGFAAAIVLAAATAGSTLAQDKAPPPPPCTDAQFRVFDFWAGAWDVYNANGKKAGDNTITIEEGGCLLVEHWAGAGGGTGQSYNFVDRATGKWRQVWVSAGATIGAMIRMAAMLSSTRTDWILIVK